MALEDSLEAGLHRHSSLEKFMAGAANGERCLQVRKGSRQDGKAHCQASSLFNLTRRACALAEVCGCSDHCGKDWPGIAVLDFSFSNERPCDLD